METNEQILSAIWIIGPLIIVAIVASFVLTTKYIAFCSRLNDEMTATAANQILTVLSIQSKALVDLMTMQMKEQANYNYLFNIYLTCLLRVNNYPPVLIIDFCINQCQNYLLTDENEAIRNLLNFLIKMKEGLSNEITFTINDN